MLDFDHVIDLISANCKLPNFKFFTLLCVRESHFYLSQTKFTCPHDFGNIILAQSNQYVDKMKKELVPPAYVFDRKEITRDPYKIDAARAEVRS